MHGRSETGHHPSLYMKVLVLVGTETSAFCVSRSQTDDLSVSQRTPGRLLSLDPRADTGEHLKRCFVAAQAHS